MTTENIEPVIEQDYKMVDKKLKEIETDISKVTSFDELFKVLKKIGIIEISKGNGILVPPEGFIKIINDIIAGKADIKTLTWDAGIRKKVEELLLKEKMH
jgi:hypothetical protein